MARVRPLLAVLLLLVWILVTALLGRAPAPGQTLWSLVSSAILWQVAAAAALLGLAALVLRWKGLALRPPRAGSGRLLWLPGLYLLVLAAVAATLGPPPPAALAFVLLNMLLVGFSEELMFRGILFSGLRDRLSLWPAAAGTSLLFGAVHILNVGATGHLQGALLQSVAAGMLGLLFLGLRVGTDSLWPPVLVHAAWNSLLLMVGRGQPPIPPDEPIPLAVQAGLLGALLPLGFYGLWLLRQGNAPALRPRPAGPIDPWGAPRA